MSKPTEAEKHLLMLGAALVRQSPKAASIIAAALVEMEEMRLAKKKRRKK